MSDDLTEAEQAFRDLLAKPKDYAAWARARRDEWASAHAKAIQAKEVAVRGEGVQNAQKRGRKSRTPKADGAIGLAKV